MPSWPAESISTGIASAFAVVTPRMLPIKQLRLTGCSDPITGTIAQGGIAAAVDAVFERTLTNGCTLAAGGVVFERTLTNGRVGDASVGKERSITNGRVVVAGIIAKERLITVGRIVAPSGVAIERFLTDGGIVEAAKTVIGEAEKGVLPFCGVAFGITSIGRWNNRLRVLDERKADESNCD